MINDLCFKKLAVRHLIINDVKEGRAPRLGTYFFTFILLLLIRKFLLTVTYSKWILGDQPDFLIWKAKNNNNKDKKLVINIILGSRTNFPSLHQNNSAGGTGFWKICVLACGPLPSPLYLCMIIRKVLVHIIHKLYVHFCMLSTYTLYGKYLYTLYW